MKTLNVIVESAIVYHEPDDRAPGKVIAAAPETYPVPTATETTIPETPGDFVFFQVKNSEGRVLFQLLISEYFNVVGTIDGDLVINEHRHMNRPKTPRPATPQPKAGESKRV